ncbi:MAG: hypothetical protein ABWZ79_07075 [Pedobacter agri]|uniref:hypothetical protein n=1 Tax=Pedobacter agri TaxID=454586 RepID=UPI002782D3A2|nr:hypothetical protein [Pedobacter agri]MDQ1142668.1 uncharacterized membrane protein (DUF106 family) [Pedobacter agri]
MGINYVIVILIALAVLGLIVWLTKKNIHDKKKVEGKGNPLEKNADKRMEEL